MRIFDRIRELFSGKQSAAGSTAVMGGSVAATSGGDNDARAGSGASAGESSAGAGDGGSGGGGPGGGGRAGDGGGGAG